MLIAKVNGNTVLEVADMRSMFPNTSFAVSGPEQAWLTDNSCLPVSVFVDYDNTLQQLEPCDPYIQNGIVYTVHAVSKPVVNTTTATETAANTTSNATISGTASGTISGTTASSTVLGA